MSDRKLKWNYYGTEGFAPDKQMAAANPHDDQFIPYGIDYRQDGFCLGITLSLRGYKTMEEAQDAAQKIENSIRPVSE